MLSGLRNAFKVKDLRRRIVFTLLMFLIFRAGVHITVPGVNPELMKQFFGQGQLFAFFDVIAGGGFLNFSIFALNVTPYITASIIVQLLTIVFPRLEQLAKEGEEGRKKLAQFTRYGTVALAFLQALGITFAIRGAVVEPGALTIILIAFTLTAGTAFLMWLGEQITEHGIGNGISLIIFAGIVSRLPAGAESLAEALRLRTVGYGGLLAVLIVALLAIVLVVYVQEGQRRIPVQYAKRVVGRRMYGGQSTHIPLKVNMAGVIPVIFASSLLLFPLTVTQFVQHPIATAINNALSFGRPLNTVLYVVFVMFFTYFYTAIQFNPVEVSDNIKKYGGFIPGIRPGRPTTEYLTRVVNRITLVGAVFLAAIVTLPIFTRGLSPLAVSIGGTALLIVVGVALETMKQIEAHLLMRHYKGFIK
ncbi:MAG: preprotein translocase subunit SecY [Firmicutes bacterium]|nr:preprotein translocase subunit SecY [Bacillota bacterium]